MCVVTLPPSRDINGRSAGIYCLIRGGRPQAQSKGEREGEGELTGML